MSGRALARTPPIQIDRRAPITGASGTEIAAGREVVWELLTDIDRWPSWNPQVRSATLRGALAVGAEFRWNAGPWPVTSIIRRLEPPTLIAWTGRTFGLEAIHVWRLEPRHGNTFITTEESYGGFVAHVLRRRVERALDNGVDSGLRHLKAEAERRG